MLMQPLPMQPPSPYIQVELSAERTRHTEEMQQVQVALDEATSANKERLQVIGGFGGLSGSSSSSGSGSAKPAAAAAAQQLQPASGSAGSGSGSSSVSDDIFASVDVEATLPGDIDFDQARPPLVKHCVPRAPVEPRIAC